MGIDSLRQTCSNMKERITGDDMKQIIKCFSLVLILSLLCSAATFADVLSEEPIETGEELLLESDGVELNEEVIPDAESTEINGFVIEVGNGAPEEASALIESKAAWIEYLMQVLHVENYVTLNGREPEAYQELSVKYEDAFFADHKLAVTFASVPNQQDRLEYVSSTQNGGLVEQAYTIWYSADEMVSPLVRSFLIISEASADAETVSVSCTEEYGVEAKGFLRETGFITGFEEGSMLIDSAEQLAEVFGEDDKYSDLTSKYDDAYFADHKLAVSCVRALNDQDMIIYCNTAQYGKTVEQKYQFYHAPDTLLSPLEKSFVIVSEVSPEAEEVVLLKEDLYPGPETIVLNKAPDSLVAGKTAAIGWAVLPGNATSTKVAWESSDPSVVKVNQKGTIRGVKAGSATVSVCSAVDSKVKNSFKVNVLFKDVRSESAYYYKPVYWALNAGYAEGISDTAFGPGEICTRSDLIQMLWKMAGAPYSKGKLSFTDTMKLAQSSDEYQAILWGTKNGIVSGYKNGNFGRNGKVTRKQAMLMLYRVAGKPAVKGTLKFTDVKDAKNTQTYKAILWGTKNKITSGVSATSFNPDDYCKRCQIVTFLYKYAK